jgi:hypothetical protein
LRFVLGVRQHERTRQREPCDKRRAQSQAAESANHRSQVTPTGFHSKIILQALYGAGLRPI